ncbi:DNase I-like protein [Ramicandelaber brevisporus]|nr:DNase I-like protein [Ramicandelaber brevisporus]
MVKVLTLNVFMRPPLIKSNESDYKDSRLEYLIKRVLPQYEVVVLQEMFNFGTSRRQKLLSEAIRLGYKYSYCSEAKSVWNVQIDGGLVILSKYPIVKTASVNYERGIESDWMCAKGALYARVAVNNDNDNGNDGSKTNHVHIFTTHTQASYNVVRSLDNKYAQIRLQQLTILHKFIADQVSSSDIVNGEPILVLGDFNVDARGSELINVVHDTSGISAHHGYYSDSRNCAAVSVRDHAIEYDAMIPKNSPVIDLCDVIYEQYGEHPVTFGDILKLPDGSVVPRESAITGENGYRSCQCLDYILVASTVNLRSSSSSSNNDKLYTISDTRVEPLFVDPSTDPGLPFTQASDHYGVSINISF